MAEGFRKIDPTIVGAPADTPGFGAAPMLQWLKIADLVVDDRYQRQIRGAGRTNVKRIAEAFRWSKFAPVIVAPVAGGLFAIIDGQHRATAAAVLGIESVPAQVVTADAVEQADAFKSINGQVTRISALSLHHAACVAGDDEAVEIAAIGVAAGVTILRYPVSAANMKAGETLALGAIRSNLRFYGPENVIAALNCITGTVNNVPGALGATTIHALCATLGGNAAWAEGGGALLDAFDQIDIDTELDEARITRRAKMTALWEVLADRFRAQLRDLMPAREVA